MQYVYSIYGLGIDSDCEVPGLPAANSHAPADIHVWMRDKPSWVDDATAGHEQLQFDSADACGGGPASVQVWRYLESRAYRFAYVDGVDFVVDERGSRIWGSYAGSATLRDAASYLTGVILGFACRLRGRIALHASAAVINERAVLLAGAAGAGKSTTAAAFCLMGYEILADDVCVLLESAGEFWVEPAHPGVRLCSDAVEAIFGATDALPEIAPGWDKRLFSLCGEWDRFRRSRLPVGAIYCLRGDQWAEDSPMVETLPQCDLMMKLIGASYPGYLLDADMRAVEFDPLARLAASVPGRSVTVCNDIGAVQETCRCIANDFQASTGSFRRALELS